MFEDTRALSGFTVHDVREARRFYGETIGTRASEESEPISMPELSVAGGQDVPICAKPDHAPASSTVLGSRGDDLEEAVDVLAGRGVRFERYEGAEQVEKGTFRGGGPPIAWFKDPAGNVLSVIQLDRSGACERVPQIW